MRIHWEDVTPLPVVPSTLYAAVCLFALSMLAVFVSRRSLDKDAQETRVWLHYSLARLALLGAFILSWMFVCMSGIILAINAAFASWTSCMVAQYMCITLYGCAKLGVYLFLIERVHVVWAPQLHTGRLRSPVYIGCLLNVLAYPTYGVVVLITKGYKNYMTPELGCIIGIKGPVAIVAIAYDVWINVLLTALFLHPLLHAGRLSPVLRRLARRTLGATLTTLVISLINVISIFICAGQPLWLCFALCVLDIVASAAALFWVTARPAAPPSPPSSVTTVGGSGGSGGGRGGGRGEAGGRGGESGASVLFASPWAAAAYGGRPVASFRTTDEPDELEDENAFNTADKHPHLPLEPAAAQQSARASARVSLRSSMFTFGSAPSPAPSPLLGSPLDGASPSARSSVFLPSSLSPVSRSPSRPPSRPFIGSKRHSSAQAVQAVGQTRTEQLRQEARGRPTSLGRLAGVMRPSLVCRPVSGSGSGRRRHMSLQVFSGGESAIALVERRESGGSLEEGLP